MRSLEIPAPPSDLSKVVVVLTGGANGIGAATVRLLHSLSASVVFGDLDRVRGAELLSSLSPANPPNVDFVPTDVTRYSDNVALFKHALSLHGRVDHAVSIAGVNEGQNWFRPGLSIEDVEVEPDTKTLDVNLTATAYFARVALAYLHATPPAPGVDEAHSEQRSKSLTFLASTASFIPSPGVALYGASKHGVLALMRSFAPHSELTHRVRVNAVCPWMADTRLVAAWRDWWIENKLPMNSGNDVAKVVLGLAVGRYNGKAVLVEGGRSWDYEGRVEELEEELYGEESERYRLDMRKGQEFAIGLMKPQKPSKM
ncbi:MAG: hypothetical protein MMC23_007517 [Stictis urceolatum]|nr:hypothetical protein [Stictis urceolata]